jgi:uncharacterized repeat protein (TIGR03803 family)
VFEITPTGVLSTLVNFDIQNGDNPFASLVQGTDGDLYGATTWGGPDGDLGPGTLFKITPEGALTSLYDFNYSDGAYPTSDLIQGTDGMFYSNTNSALNADGVIFRMDVGLHPFVKTLPIVGKVNTRVTILGNALTGTTSVTFNGTAATFTVVSGTEITTTVPTGATTGKVQVTTPSGTLTSNVVFRVK